MIRVRAHTPLLIALALCIASETAAQPPKKATATSSLCTRTNAIDNTKQQILFTRTMDRAAQRIAVLLRAADLLWPHDQERSMATFMEAFDVAVQDFKEQGDQTRRTSQSQFAAVIALPDQRFKVISALAKRDSAKARKLSEQMLEDAAREATDKPAADNRSQMRTAEKLLTLAHGLAPTDAATALSFARQSLRYPATLHLTIFLYQLARTDQRAADLFWQEALVAYRAAPMDQFLYLSAYPFGNTRDAGEMPGYKVYAVPEGYGVNVALPNLFTRQLLARAQAGQETAVQPAPNRLSDIAQMWLALSRLEPQIRNLFPALADEAVQARDRLYTLLTPPTQKRVTSTIAGDERPKRTFDDLIEAAEKQSNPDDRDRDIALAAIQASRGEPLEKVLNVIDKISDTTLRGSVLNWFYFFGAQSLIKDKNLDEARKYATKVTELDLRAYLFSRIAEESIKQAEDQTQARELLNEIGDAAAKAPKTIVSARALLALANLYAKIDINRGIEELGNAVKTINAIESPDFSQQFTMMKLEGKTFGSFASFPTPGFSPENAFSEMGKLDFDSSLMQATTFTDKSLRALTTLAVIEPCLEITAKPTPKKSKQ
jgi:hypothetical protein